MHARRHGRGARIAPQAQEVVARLQHEGRAALVIGRVLAQVEREREVAALARRERRRLGEGGQGLVFAPQSAARRAQIELRHLAPGARAGVRYPRADAHLRPRGLRAQALDGEGGVAQAEAEGPARLYAEAVEPAVAHVDALAVFHLPPAAEARREVGKALGPAVRQPPAGLRCAREHVEEGAAHLHPALGGVEHSVQPQLIVKAHVDGRAGVDDQHHFRVQRLQRAQVAQLGAGYVVGAPFRRAVGALAGLPHEDIDGGAHTLRRVLGRDLAPLRRDEGVLPGHVRLPRQRHAADELRHLPLPAAARGGHALVVVV